MFGVQGMRGVTIPTDPIRRVIGHILKYSERPVPCSIPASQDHYTVDQLLSVQNLERPVLFSSGFSRTGWGCNLWLVAAELTQAFDLLPSFLSWDNLFPNEMIPLEMCRVVIDAILDEMRMSEEGVVPKILKTGHDLSMLKKTRTSRDDAVWLTAIGKWLPGAWADAPISDRAVKSDNAAVDFTPWHKRIQLVLPCCPAGTIESIETFGIRVWRRRIFASFLSYLRTTYGVCWSQTASLSALQAQSKGRIGPSAKRRKVLGDTGTQNTEGGTVFTRVMHVT